MKQNPIERQKNGNLKITGRLFLGWQWIILTIAVDLMIAPSVKDLRTLKYY